MLSFLDASAVRSILVRPEDTFRSFRQFSALSDRIPSFSEAYRVYLQTNHPGAVPPLLMLLASRRLQVGGASPSYDWIQTVLWRLLLLIVDMLIARSLERIGNQVILPDEHPWEEPLESDMPEAIRPPHLVAADGRYGTNESMNPDGDPSSTAVLQPLLSIESLPFFAACLYYCSPVTMLASGMYGSMGSVGVLLVLWATERASLWISGLCLAIASYCFGLWYLVFAIPIVLRQYRNKTKATKGPFADASTAAPSIIIIIMIVLILLMMYIATTWLLPVESDYYIRGTFTPPISMSPSLSPQWYFWMQVFDRFRPFFYILLNALPWMLVIPLTIRLHRYPTVLSTCFWWVGMLFRSNPTLVDLNFGLCLMVVSPRSMIRMMAAPCLIALCSLPVPVILYVLDYSLWLESGSGNANYIYFQCLAYQVFVTIVFLNFVSASLQRDKALRMIEKESRRRREQEQTT